jgi:hypothetical protein
MLPKNPSYTRYQDQSSPLSKISPQLTVSQVVMTPIIFVSFLISLVIVDMRYTVMRSHFHPEEYSTRLPRWLHRILYSYQPYQYVRVGKDGKPIKDHAHHGFYHSKQKKLMKMEVDDAFQIRRRVLVVLGILGLVTLWCLWRAVAWILRTSGLW